MPHLRRAQGAREAAAAAAEAAESGGQALRVVGNQRSWIKKPLFINMGVLLPGFRGDCSLWEENTPLINKLGLINLGSTLFKRVGHGAAERARENWVGENWVKVSFLEPTVNGCG